MALEISGYTDTGVYIGEVIVPGSVSLSTVPTLVCMIGVANRNKRATNEAVTRGAVSGEALTVSSTVSAHDATLVNRSNRKSAQTTIYRDGTALDSSQWSFQPAKLTGMTLPLTTFDFTTTNEIGISLDGLQPVTIKLIAGVSDATTTTGSLITQALASMTGSVATVTLAMVAEGINKALANTTVTGYGLTYGAVASVVSDAVVITSPLSSSASDVAVYAGFPTSASATALVFSGTLPVRAATVVRVSNAQYSALSTYTASYIATNNDIDSLAQSTAQTMVRCGAYVNTSTYTKDTDFTFSSNQVNWSIDAAATFTSSVQAATHNLSTNDTVLLSFDGKTSVSIDLNGLASPPPGYANPVSAAAATPLEIAANINAVFAAHASYGPAYRSVATVIGSGATSQIVLTSPSQGVGSYIEFGSPPSFSAMGIFGLSAGQLPYSVRGTGMRPSPGVAYFVTYEYTRPSNDYNVVKQFFTPDSLFADIGNQTSANKLAIAAGLAFQNGAPSVAVIQVNDSLSPGTPSQSEFQAAFTAAAQSSAITDVVALTTSLNVQVDLMQHVEAACAPTEKKYRRAWFGMARGTLIGDKDTPDTYVYRAARTLQVAANSPARGRLILAAPANVSKTFVLESGAETTVDLDSTYVSAAVAGRMAAFTGTAESLVKKTIVGFNIDTFQTYLKAERAQLAQNGCLVATLDAGRIVLLDPISTEAGGGRLPQFQEISASVQKDATTRAVDQVVDTNLIGIVPTDPAAFVTLIKQNVATAIRALIGSGSIGPFRDSSGSTRDLDTSVDIQAFQDKSDPTKFHFRYWYNLRYPAKRVFGEYSVDRAFFG